MILDFELIVRFFKRFIPRYRRQKAYVQQSVWDKKLNVSRSNRQTSHDMRKMLFVIKKSKLQFLSHENAFESRIADSLKCINSKLDQFNEQSQKNHQELKKMLKPRILSHKEIISPTFQSNDLTFDFSEKIK